ncbi:major head protein [Pseudomonas phage Noxifer]|uniref:Major capsid protein n=1 Tax=Pseudomonas phage Noxifer TaxID=2006684 RepID=A0A1Y0SUV9_9CAUD|nr:major head protein [Pseudomonas phage Noxifer]ARV77291.1 major capsid protein [Pseudomonas phage Noxifer]
MENIKQLFDKRANVSKGFTVQALVKDLEDNIKGAGSTLRINEAIAERVSNEEFGSADVSDKMQNVYEELDRALSTLSFEHFNADRKGDAGRVGENMKAAAAMGLFGASNETAYKKALMASTRSLTSSDANIITVRGNMVGAHGSIPAFGENVSLENYNEKSSRDFRVVTAAYNLTSSRQDAFAEAIYRTTLVNAQEGGAVQIVPYVALLKDVYHKTTGAKWDTKEINVVDAYRDPSILDQGATLLFPAVQAGNQQHFVAAADVAVEPKTDERGHTYNTAPLKFGAKFDLIGISNFNALVAGGVLDLSDTLDPAGSMKNLYIKVAGNGTETAQVIKFKTDKLQTATFVPKLIGDTRGIAVSFETEKLKIHGLTRGVGGASLEAIDSLAAAKYSLLLSIKVDGTISVSRGSCQFISGPVTVEGIRDEDGEVIDHTTGAGAAIVAKLGALTALGYDLDARFTNTNKRKRGQLIQTRAVQFRYPIWMHSPVTLPLSVMDEQGPGEVAKALTVVTDIRNSANAVTAALNYVAQLKEVVGDSAAIAEFGDVEGALSIMMRPTYRYFKLDLTGRLDTIRSGDRWNDVTSAILNTIKALLFPAYRDSNIESVFQVVSGNIDEKPKFLIATDREIANYLIEVGDNRTLGAYLKYDVVATNNKDMDGKILVLPTRENPSENDVLSWGQFFFVPTIVGDMPIARDGQTSREITAVPFNRHVNNIPFAIEIDVTGLRDVMTSSMYNAILA